MKRSERADLARQTLTILDRGHYQTPSGQRIHLRDAQANAERRTTLHTPEVLDQVLAEVLAQPPQANAATVEVSGETTLEAGRRLASLLQEGSMPGGEALGALNFASARNAGGGFLGGSQAQEESLARSSGLYPCLMRQPAYYELHRRLPSGFYTHHMIMSPAVPVFRADDGALLEEPWQMSILTSPAVNAGVVRRKRGLKESDIGPVMIERTARMLALAVKQGCSTLILGAWGCGVFANDPAQIAGIFADALTGPMRFRHRFERICFAVYDPSRKQRTRQAFEDALQGL